MPGEVPTHIAVQLVVRQVELQGSCEYEENGGGGLEVGGQLIGKVVVGVGDREDERSEDEEGGDNKRALTTAVEGAVASSATTATAGRKTFSTATILFAFTKGTPHPEEHRAEHKSYDLGNTVLYLDNSIQRMQSN
ncbi:uncharacterized protein BcabD6B2_48890 [Babesia caballi]|uniref:Uncharacterized protein n=1 Tax=Babesia caballi TaxID=5871 RepID=A0AAV4LZC4_BABCB|nr:hypothetical protein BcabD6B2_48890 [Babesia caballi]